ncbi:hypothetical protein SUGI_0995960 [Cryptomeria japonica]|nr:hypothetical protein SUGI_0995960 [Cryptomeria japonica]
MDGSINTRKDRSRCRHAPRDTFGVERSICNLCVLLCLSWSEQREIHGMPIRPFVVGGGGGVAPLPFGVLVYRISVRSESSSFSCNENDEYHRPIHFLVLTRAPHPPPPPPNLRSTTLSYALLWLRVKLTPYPDRRNLRRLYI